MALFRAMSVRRSPMMYEHLGEEPTAGLLEAKLERAKSVNPFKFGSSKSGRGNPPVKPASKNPVKSHPLFSLLGKKKPTANPDFARYLQYVKEGGTWDAKSNKPVIYYK